MNDEASEPETPKYYNTPFFGRKVFSILLGVFLTLFSLNILLMLCYLGLLLGLVWWEGSGMGLQTGDERNYHNSILLWIDGLMDRWK